MACRCSIIKWLLFAIVSSLAEQASAQLAPSGEHYAGRASDTGYGGTVVDATGNFPVAVPLVLPPARGGLPIPLQISYGARGVGAAGTGWDLPLSYLRRSNTLAHGRPPSGPNEIPKLQQRTTLSLLGQNAQLLPESGNWIARVGTLELIARESAGGWLVYDGQGRTYTFEVVAGLQAEGLWLLKSITASTGAKLELTYQIGSWPLDGGSGTAIDLIRIDYNAPLDQPPELTCAKNEITLEYLNGSTAPIAMSLLDDKVLVRKNTLTQIDISGRADCYSAPQRLRRYRFQYTPDADTGLPRLSTVIMFGRQGTPEENITVPVASYSYGSATNNGALKYQQTQVIQIPTGVVHNQISGTQQDSSVNVPEQGDRYAMWQTLIDFTGDGRPDLIFKKNNTLWIAKGLPAPGGATTFGVGAQALAQLTDSTLTSGPISTQSSLKARFQYAPANRNTTDVWRQAIDVNGDGRIDIIDAAEEADHWVIYLNTPGSPSGIKWERRSFSVKSLRATLTSYGHKIEGDHVPLSRRATGTNIQTWECWRWENNKWNWYSAGFQNHRCQGVEGQVLGRGPERTFVEWQLVDLNGDGYPDFIFNSDPVDFQLQVPSSTPRPVDGATRDGPFWGQFAPGKGTNEIRAAFNIRGVRFDTDTEAFSRSFNVLAVAADQGISQWTCLDLPCDENQSEFAGFADVNGDGLLDRVVGTKAYLGTYSGTAHTFSPIYITLPGPLSTQRSDHNQQCVIGGQLKSTAEQTQGLRDLTGDGIPDYFDHGQVWIGTGTGFRSPVPIVSSGANFRFSHQTETCNGDISNTDGGLYDIDGDGKPEVIGLIGSTFVVSQLVGGELPGVPEAGRLTAIDNGYGAITSISYVSAKEFTDNAVPFPEVVVSSISTSGTNGLGGTLGGFRYAYGRGELVFDSALDRFAFPGYGRRVVVRLLDVASVDKGVEGIATITDTWPLGPFQLPMTKQQRWLRNQRVGRVSDVFKMRALVDVNPWLLLEILSADPRLIGAAHYDYDAKLYEIPLDPNENVFNCFEMVAPLDYQATLTSLGPNTLDVCRAHGFAFQAFAFTWYGDAPPALSDQNLQTLVQTLAVDDFGRPLIVQYTNDVFRADDDFCVMSTYATPVASVPRVLNALSSRRIDACGKVENNYTIASESWLYDNLSFGSVSVGHITSHDVDRRATDTGVVLNTVHEFDASYDTNGNLASLRTQRDAATRTTAIVYDQFGIVPIRTTIAGSGVPSNSVTLSYDPVSLLPLASTDSNDTRRGIEYDGFGRPLRVTLTLAGGQLGVMSTTTYAGFGGGDPAGKRITVTRFADPVAPANVATARGRSGTTFLDELGRRRRIELSLGSDYADAKLTVGLRVYDGGGRIAFVADPFSGSFDPADTYGTSYYYKDTGGVDCAVRGHGHPLTLNPTTDIAAERFPTCFDRSFAQHTDTFDVRDASSSQANSPQSGVVRRVVRTAIGRVIERATLQSGTPLEDAVFSYDRLGQQTSFTRYLDPVGRSGPVTWLLQHDSRGQTLQLTEPAGSTRSYTHSDWGEPVQTTWIDGSVTRSVVRSYDSLGRMTRKAELNNGVIDPDTVSTYSYDVGVNVSPLVTPTFVQGEMAQATSSTGSVAFSYDALGLVNARVFTDDEGRVYVETAQHSADGSLAALAFNMPDDNYALEEVKYGYDSAGRLRTMNFISTTGAQELYNAESIDLFGRVRVASYGGTTALHADYAPDGRGLLRTLGIKSTLGSRLLTFDQYDPVGRELSRQQLNDGVSTTATALSYDVLGRLASAVQTSGPAPFSWTFDYDSLGNIHGLHDGLGTADARMRYQALDRDRLCRIRYGKGIFPSLPCDVDHDGGGNVIYMPTRTGGRQLTYFSSGDVRTIDDGNNQARFAYDAFGELQTLDVQSGPGQSLHEGRYGGLIERRDAVTPSGPTSLIIRKIPGPTGIVATRRGSGNDWVYQFGELRGNRFFTNQDGSFVQGVDYQPFGEAQSIGAGPGTTDFSSSQWNGGRALAEFGLSRLGKRLYDPVIGRFLNRDSLRMARTATSSNPYAFSRNDPWNAADPSGLDDCGGNFGQECQYLNTLTPIGLALGLLQSTFGRTSAPAAPAPPVSTGPQTAAGQALMAASLKELGYPRGSSGTLSPRPASAGKMHWKPSRTYLRRKETRQSMLTTPNWTDGQTTLERPDGRWWRSVPGVSQLAKWDPWSCCRREWLPRRKRWEAHSFSMHSAQAAFLSKQRCKQKPRPPSSTR